MKRNHSGYHRSTIYRRIKRQMKAYYEVTEEPEPAVPSTSTAVGNQSPEREMPILNSEASAGRKKFVRRLTSDSEDDEDENIAERQPVRPLAGWPSPPPILQLQTEKDASVVQSEILKSVQRELKSVRKKLDKLVHNQTVHHEEFRQHCALMDAYEDFEGKLNRDANFREEVMKQLVLVGGRNNKEFVRNILSAIRLNPIFGDCGQEMVRKTVIDWFHGSRDRYGGRAKRREAIGGTSDDARCPTLPPFEETEPAVDAGTSGTPN
nr:unnamed protein product [Spirometra erinaceieuropaei]